MAETINLPGIGPTKATYVWIGGALVAGIVGYAWWKNAQASANADYVGASPDDFGVGDYDSPLGSSGGNSGGSYSTLDPNALDTNAKWVSFAVEKLASYNYDAATVSSALGKYLARKGLTESEIDIVQQAIAVAGPPPVGGPYPITNALPGTPSTGNPDPDPNEGAVYADITEGLTLPVFLDRMSWQHPEIKGLSLSRLKELNPGLTWAYSKAGVGYVSENTFGATPTFGYNARIRIK